MVSIIILTFNRYKLLIRAVNSVLKQSYGNFEIILLNDGSTDETSNLLELFKDKRIKLYNLKKQNNLARLRNIGIQHSSGEYIAFCDDDDLWEQDKLTEQLKYMSDYDFVCTNSYKIDHEDKVIGEQYVNLNESCILTTEMLLIENYVLTPSVLIKKIILDPLKPFDEINYRNLCEDYNLWIKLSLENNLFFLNQNLIKVRAHASWSRNLKNAIEINKNHIKLAEPFTLSSINSLKEAAFMSILNNRIYGLKYLIKNRKYLITLRDFITLLLLFRNLNYITALKFKIKNFFRKNRAK